MNTPAARAREIMRVHTYQNKSLNDADVVVDVEDMTNAIAAALEQERREAIEACAKVCDRHASQLRLLRSVSAGYMADASMSCASYIRALAQRGDENGISKN